MLRSSFASFTTALLGLRASQTQLDITGQNLANINTIGYTRQRADLYSLSMNGRDMYSSSYSSKVGYGVIVGNVSQLRDPFLDVRFREEMSNLGGADAKASVLNEMQDILDELQKSGIDEQLTGIRDALNSFAGDANSTEFQNLVKNSMESLVKLFNKYSTQFDSAREDIVYNMENADVKSVNESLYQLAELNKNIAQGEIYGNNCLELRDERNLLLDDLSTYFNLEVKYTVKELSPETKVEYMSLSFKDPTSNTSYEILNHDNYAQFDFSDDGEKGTLNRIYNGVTTDITDNMGDCYFSSYLGMLNDSGSFDSVSDLRGDILDKMLNAGGEVDQVNGLLRRIADMNTKINESEKVNRVYDTALRDQRDSLLKELSRFVDIETEETKDPNNPYSSSMVVRLKNSTNAGAPGSTLINAGTAGMFTSTRDTQGTTDPGDDKVSIGVISPGTTTGDIKGSLGNPGADSLQAKIAALDTAIANMDGAGGQINQVNTILDEIARLSGQIDDPATPEGNIAALKQQRDDQVTALQAFMEVDAYETKDTKKFMVTLKDSGARLVSGDVSGSLSFSQNPTKLSLTSPGKTKANPINDLLGRGSLAQGIKDIKTALSDVNKTEKEVNRLLDEIGTLNGKADQTSIDKKQAFITELKKYVDVTVTSNDPATVPPTPPEDAPNVKIALANGGTELINKNGAGSISYTYTPNVNPVNPSAVTVTSPAAEATVATDETANLGKKGSLASDVARINDPTGITTKGIDKGVSFYRNMLDEMANKFADVFNTVNIDHNGNEKPLFQTSDGTGRITAANIAISDGWRNNDYGITTSKTPDANGDIPASQKDNILKMMDLLTASHQFSTPTGTNLFKGSFQEYFTDIGNTMALEKKSTETLLKNYVTVANSINGQRDQISAVSMDEEGINMLQFQKSYNAAARLMTTLDEALDTIINGMGTVGR